MYLKANGTSKLTSILYVYTLNINKNRVFDTSHSNIFFFHEDIPLSNIVPSSLSE